MGSNKVMQVALGLTLLDEVSSGIFKLLKVNNFPFFRYFCLNMYIHENIYAFLVCWGQY